VAPPAALLLSLPPPHAAALAVLQCPETLSRIGLAPQNAGPTSSANRKKTSGSMKHAARSCRKSGGIGLGGSAHRRQATARPLPPWPPQHHPGTVS
jgi:hypothetical protein